MEESRLKLSYSSISVYEKCPLQYKFQYVDRLPMEPTPALSFGASLHSVLEWFYSVGTPHPPKLEELLAKLDELWVSEGFDRIRANSPGNGQDQEEKYKAHAREVLTIFYHSNASSFRLPLALEHRFSLDLGDFLLTGCIDRVDRHPDGSYEIIDYKTNRRLPTLDQLREDLQLPIYQLAASEIWGIIPAKLTFYYLLPNQKYSTGGFDATRMEMAINRIREVARRIGEGHFQPKRNPLCPWCDFAAQCPLIAEGRSELAYLADRYADLLHRRRIIEDMMSEIADRIDELWPEDQPHAIHGENFSIKRVSSQQGWIYQLIESETREDARVEEPMDRNNITPPE